MKDLFKPYEQRLISLGEQTRELAVKYAEQFYREDNMDKGEALDKGIAKAEKEVGHKE